MQQPLSHSPISPQHTMSQIAQKIQSTPAVTSSFPHVGTDTSNNQIAETKIKFLSTEQQAKFVRLFKSAVGDNQSVKSMYL